MKTLNMKRLAWVLIVNTSAGFLIVKNLLSERQMYKLLDTPLPGRGYVLPFTGLLLLIIGTVAGLSRIRAARFVNVGIFLIPTIYAIYLFAATYRSSPEGRALSLLFGVPCAVISLITWLIYRFGREAQT
jgi:hypothetical protein